MNYCQLEKFLENVVNAKVEIIGESVLKRHIYSVNFDFGNAETIIIQGSIHAREHIVSDLICLLIQEVSSNFNKYKAMNTPNIVFIPMLNPDGVQLCHFGLKSVKNKEKKKFLFQINKKKDFSLFKANANGVDLNTNFDAKWGSGKENKLYPGPSDFIGDCPMSEPEVQAIAVLTSKIKPVFTISYHAKGEEIYYNFYNRKENLQRDKKIAKIIARTLHYKLVNLENVSGGGYKDWCILRFKIPAVTIEVGKDSLSHPIDNKALNQIYSRNKNIIKALNKVMKVINEQ